MGRRHQPGCRGLDGGVPHPVQPAAVLAGHAEALEAQRAPLEGLALSRSALEAATPPPPPPGSEGAEAAGAREAAVAEAAALEAALGERTRAAREPAVVDLAAGRGRYEPTPHHRRASAFLAPSDYVLRFLRRFVFSVRIGRQTSH